MTSAPSNKRRSERLQHELLVAYRTVDGFITDWATNISKGGLFINSRAPLPVGTTVRLIVSLPDTAFPFDLTGKVTRVSDFSNSANEAPGMGIEFTDVDEEKRARIERFVDKLRRELPADLKQTAKE
ncbi:MAG: TIGR02266 family protein [Myxococcales bacterium]|jgi:type IV pilus assembly protein PilZ